MDRDAIRRRVVWILYNHDLQESLLKDQLERSSIALAEDLDRIYGAVGLKGVSYEDTKVLSSIKDDARIATVIALAEDRREHYDSLQKTIRMELEAIESVYRLVCLADDMDKAVLLALYYPKRTYAEAGRILGYSIRAVTRFRSVAIEHLVDIICRES